MIERKYFGALEDGREVYNYILKNENGMTAEISEFGGAIVRLLTPDRKGAFADVVFGYDDLYSYANGDGYQGALIGRWGNRICKGQFTLDGVDYQLAINNGVNHLHGGVKGQISHKIWDAEAKDGDDPTLTLKCFSPDGEENYPGNLSVTVVYTLTKDNALSIRYTATTDKKTVINLTNHSYFNLGGYASGKIYDHILMLDAESFLRIDDTLIPTGEMVPVEGTPFDFRKPTRVGDNIHTDYPDVAECGGFDHCVVFNDWRRKPDAPVLRGTLYCPATGREMEVYTDQPCVQLYSGNFMINPEFPYKAGYPQSKHSALCLETERMPDAMNHEGFTPCTLDAGEVYDYTTVYKFNVK